MLTSALALLLLPHYAVSGAELFTVDAWRFGKFEARVRFAPSDGVVSSFFLWKPDSELADVYWNEVDIEKIGNCHYSSNVFWGIPESQMPQELEVEEDICGEWHTHAIEWTPEAIVWKLDGHELRRVEGELAAAFEANAPEGMQIRFNLWVGTPDFGGNWSDTSLPDYQFIQWVAYSAYTPGAGDEGSDFTSEWREDFEGDQVPAAWATGNWESPLGQSQHAPENVVFRDGVAVLALTADDALGFDGTPPEDSDSPPGDDSTGDSSGDTQDTSDGSEGGTTSGGTTSGGTTSGGATSGATSSADTTGDSTPGDTSGQATSTGPATASGDTASSSAPTEDESSAGGSSGTPGASETGGTGEAGGCACRATDSTGPRGMALLFGVGLAAALRRRRRTWSIAAPSSATR